MAGQAFAAAKINLFLHVGAPAVDGYHPLCSLMVFADIGDRLETHDSDVLSLRLMGPFAAGLEFDPDNNLVLRAARALAARLLGSPAPQTLSLEKRLPIAAGLGGGSSDAGAALRLLRGIWAPDFPDHDLEDVAASLGADGAACLWGRPVLAQGRGQLLSPAPIIPVMDAVLVNPRVGVSTAQVYRDLDASGRFEDVTPPSMPKAFESVEEVAGWLRETTNNMQATAIEHTPEIGDILATLADEPETLLARMSGSGATCFALCSGDVEAEGLAERLQAMRPDWWVQRCQLGGPWG